jgi:hypothetical protein
MFMIICLFINHLVVEYATTQDHKKTAMDPKYEGLAGSKRYDSPLRLNKEAPFPARQKLYFHCEFSYDNNSAKQSRLYLEFKTLFVL